MKVVLPATSAQQRINFIWFKDNLCDIFEADTANYIGITFD